MPLTNAERQRKYREKRDADPAKRMEYLMKKKAKYKADINLKKRKRVGDMTTREHRHQRKEWRHRQRSCRLRVRQEASVLHDEDDNAVSSSTSAKMRGRKTVQRNRSSLYRDNIRLKQHLRNCKAAVEKYRKRLQRINLSSHWRSKDSPRKLAKGIVRRRNHADIAKTLTFHYALVQQIKHASADKKTVASVVTGHIIRKYRFLALLQSRTGLSRKIAMKVKYGIMKKKNARALTEDDSRKIQDFYEREDNSRLCAGVKLTVTCRGVKKQKRLLSESVKNLHTKYLAEGGRISYSKFCKLRPFWVVAPRDSDRDTCQCYTHENVRYLVNALKSRGLLDTAELDTLVSRFMCCSDSSACAYGDCEICRDKEYSFSRAVETDAEMCFWQWESGQKTYMKEGQEKEVKITTKAMKTMDESEAVAMFLCSMKSFKKHCFTMSKQYLAFRECKSNVREDECIVHVDFSENFNCKYHSEIQAVHFGASHQQASLHTIVMYVKGHSPICMCTISANLIHGPIGIWAHLKPVLTHIKTEFPHIHHLTFWSDGPSTQYKQKNNFYQITTQPFLEGFKSIAWNFFESSHGKGAVDGVGATVKRIANDAVRHGVDVNTPRKVFDAVKPRCKSVHLAYIEDEEFSPFNNIPSVPTIPGTRNIHQVLSTKAGILQHRRLSCFCHWHTVGERVCPCQTPKTFTYKTAAKVTSYIRGRWGTW